MKRIKRVLSPEMQDIALYETITQPRIVEEDLKEGFQIFRVRFENDLSEQLRED